MSAVRRAPAYKHPMIKATNDMPIVEPFSLSSLGLIPLEVNVHYLDPADPTSTYQGETREERIVEYLEEGNVGAGPLGLHREGSWLLIDQEGDEGSGSRCKLFGEKERPCFRKGRAPEEYETGSDLNFLLRP